MILKILPRFVYVANTRKRVHLPNLYLAIQIAFALLACFASVSVCLSICRVYTNWGNETTSIYLISKQTITSLLSCVTYTDFHPLSPEFYLPLFYAVTKKIFFLGRTNVGGGDLPLLAPPRSKLRLCLLLSQ